MEIKDIEIVQNPTDDYKTVRLYTDRGEAEYRYYKSPSTRRAVVYVGGPGGEFYTPARDLYPRLCSELQMLGISGLRVQLRPSLEFNEAVFDVLAGLNLLFKEGVRSVAWLVILGEGR